MMTNNHLSNSVIKKYVLDISYLGTKYCGWQKQNNSVSVQEEIEVALSKIASQKINIHGSSRTDKGVHAKKQIAHFELNKQICLSDLKFKLNSLLPNDISINIIKEVPPTFHARFDAKSRTYKYFISKIANPFNHQISLYYPYIVDTHLIDKGTEIIINSSNFRSFCKQSKNYLSFTCNIKQAFWEYNQESMIFTIKSNRFLRGMVRCITGTLLSIGQKKLSIDALLENIKKEDRSSMHQNINPKGLVLYNVEY